MVLNCGRFAISLDCFNSPCTIEGGETQAGGWRNRAIQKRTLAVLKGLFNVLGDLTLGEIKHVSNSEVRAFHRIITTDSTAGWAEMRDVGVCVRSCFRDVVDLKLVLVW